MNQNPLSHYFRTPKLYIGLPSQGRFYDADVIDWPEDGELGVLAMTSRDEMLMKNPDALLNGKAILELILSCVPCVKMPERLISNDVDALLVAIQAASHGDELAISATCPNEKCEQRSIETAVSIEAILSQMEYLDEAYSFTTNSGLTIEIKPFSYKSVVKSGLVNFKTSRSLKSIAEIQDEETQFRVFSENFSQLALLNFDLIVDSVASVRGTSDQGPFVVTDAQLIREFLENCEGDIGKEIEKEVNKINSIGVPKSVQLTCDSCNTSFTHTVEFDPVNFSTAS